MYFVNIFAWYPPSGYVVGVCTAARCRRIPTRSPTLAPPTPSLTTPAKVTWLQALGFTVQGSGLKVLE